MDIVKFFANFIYHVWWISSLLHDDLRWWNLPKHERKKYNIAKLENILTISIAKRKTLLIDDSLQECFFHGYQIGALTKGFIVHLVSYSGFLCNLQLYGPSVGSKGKQHFKRAASETQSHTQRSHKINKKIWNIPQVAKTRHDYQPDRDLPLST